MARNKSGATSGQGAKRPALLEWIAGGVGAVIALTMVAVMAAEALTTHPLERSAAAAR